MFLFKSRVVRGNATRLRTFTKLHPRSHVVCLFMHVACMELEHEEQSSSSSELSSDEEVGYNLGLAFCALLVNLLLYERVVL